MRRLLLALLVAVVALDTFAAVPKRTITGKVIAPDGLTYAGSINCVMSAPATAMDGGTSVRVQSTGTLTIASDGTVSGALVANDITTPVTSYTCTTRINRTPVYTQTELIYLTTGSGTVDWGAISRPGATPYTPDGVVGSAGAVQASNGTGGLQDSGVTASGGAVAAKSVNGTRYAHLFASSGSGTDASPWSGTPNPVQAAINDCGELTGVKGGCHVVLVPGVYDLGNGSYGLAVDSSSGPVSSVVIEGMGGPGVDTFTTSNSTVVLKYSGTGTAIQLGDFTADGTQNRITGATFRNFKVIQVGTAGTGVGIFGRTLRRSLIENVQIINFLDGLVLNTVSDFNRINAVTITGSGSRGVAIGTTSSSGSAYTFSDGNGNCNGNVFTGLDVQRDSSGRTGSGNGITIENVAEGTVIRDSRFHFFSTSPQAAIWLGAARNVTIDGNYFEDNYRSIYIFGMASYGGGGPVTISNNYISKIQFRAIDSATADGATTFINGITITGNDFSTYYGGASSTAIRLDAGARRVWIQGNTFTEGGGRTITQTNIASGATYITLPAASGTVVLDPNVTPPTTAAGYYQSGDSMGLQFFPGQGRARAWALQAKQRNDITSAAGITSPAFAVLGDSVTSWSALSTLTQLRRRYGRTVLGYRNLTDTSIYQTPAETISWTGGTKYSAVDTTPTNLEQFGPCGGSYNWTAAANIHYVVNAPNVANTARIYYYCKTGGGTFSWSIYGGGTTNVNTGGCSNGTLGVTTITLQGSQLLQPGAVIDLAWVSGNVTLYGIETYGVTSVTNEALNHIEPVWCVQPGTQLATAVSFGTNTLLQSLLTTIAPSQVFVAFGTNDAAASVSASTYQTNLTTMVTTVQGALTGATKGDVVLVTPVPVGNGSHAEAYAATMEGYRTATFSVGTSKATSVWDARRWWGTFADMYTLGAYLSDDIHPSNYGRLLWAEAFAYLVGHPGWQPARNNIADTWANDANSAGYVFAAATLSPPDQSNYARVYSSTTITTLNTCNQAYWGREFTLDCHDTATWAIGSAGNIRLVVPFACSGANPANQSITLLCDGNAWVEKGRSPGFSGNYSGANSGTLSNATTWYIPGNGLLTTANSTETSAYVVSPASAVTAASLQCKVGAAVATGTWTFKLRVNGADSALTCSMTSSATSCTDTAHTVAVAAGSWLDYSMVPTSTPTAQTYAACSIVY